MPPSVELTTCDSSDEATITVPPTGSTPSSRSAFTAATPPTVVVPVWSGQLGQQAVKMSETVEFREFGHAAGRVVNRPSDIRQGAVSHAKLGGTSEKLNNSLWGRLYEV